MASDSTIVLITGSNQGIGLETVKALLRSERHYTIILGGRDINKAEEAARQASSDIKSESKIGTVQVDVESDTSIQSAFEHVSSSHTRIDCLINNAGASFDPQIQEGTIKLREAFTKAWDINVAGAHIMTSTFLPLLLESNDPRLIFVTSGMSSLELSSDSSNPRLKAPPAGLPKSIVPGSYKASKAGLNMLMVDWTRVLENDGVKVWAIAPGFLATSLIKGDQERMKQMGAGDASLGGDAICGVVEGKRDADVGKVVREYESPILPW